MRFSLVVCTFRRSDELGRLFASLVKQSFKDFEVILVDKNPPGYLQGIVESYGLHFPVKQLYSDAGLSGGRNLALPHARGQIIAFPDDDCWYAPDTLERIDKAFETLACDGLSIRILDERDQTQNRIPSRIKPITLTNLSVGSITIFISQGLIGAVGSFDPRLGPGAGTVWWGGDDVDYVIAMLKHRPKPKLLYFPDAAVYHPKLATFDDPKKTYSYSRSLGHVFHKHHLFPFAVRYSLLLFRALLKQTLLAHWVKVRHWSVSLAGFLRGWFDSP